MNIIILTGGTSVRFGSDKSRAQLDGLSMLEVLISNLPACELIIVGPKTEIAAHYIEEKPPLSGPLSAIAAGVSVAKSELIAIFATDMPFAPLLLNELMENLKGDGIVPLDEAGVAQPLSGLYRREALISALKNYETFENQSVRSLTVKLNIDLLTTSKIEYLLDIDTKDELKTAQKLIEGIRNDAH